MATLGANAEASNKITLSILEDLHSHVSGGKLTQAKGAMEYVRDVPMGRASLMHRPGRCYPQGYVASRAKEAAIVCIACLFQRLDTIDTMKIRRQRTYALPSCVNMAFAASAISKSVLLLISCSAVSISDPLTFARPFASTFSIIPPTIAMPLCFSPSL